MSANSTRRSLITGVGLLGGLVLNALLLALISRFDASAGPNDAPPPAVIPVDLSQIILPPRAAPLVPRRPPSTIKRGAVGDHKAAPVAPPMPTQTPGQSDAARTPPAQIAAQPGPPAVASGASDDATRAKVSAALRGLTGCSMMSGSDDEAIRERCRSAFTKADVAGVAINTVPDEKRVDYDGAVAKETYRLNVTAEGVIPKVGAGGIARDKGRNINVRYGCWMKIGTGATPKLHCPGVM